MDLDQLTMRILSCSPMTSKKSGGKDTTNAGEKSKPRGLSVFPTEIGKLSKDEKAKLAFKPDSMAATIIMALEKHGVEAGEKRKLVLDQVKAKFKDASDSTIRTQVYRGIVYLRAGHNQ
jgi:hypothetical protein